METFCIETCGAKVIIDTETELKEYLDKNKDKFNFPDLKIIDKDYGNNKNIFEYRNVNLCNSFVNCDENKIQLHYPIEELTKSNIIYSSRYLLEKQWGEKGKTTCHSACVEKDGKAVLILGNEGAGKTSVALNLCMKYGYSLISNDQTIIGKENGVLKAFGGTKFINLRYTSVKENIPSLINIFGDKEVEEWVEKVTVMARDLGIKEISGEVPIEQVIRVHTDNRIEKLKSLRGDNWRNNFLLYEILTENIRNTNSTIVDRYGHPIGYVPSYDTKEMYDKRVDVINTINTSSYYRYLSGNMIDIVNNIESTHKNICKGNEEDER